jgi:predicted HD phosphohydrolase
MRDGTAHDFALTAQLAAEHNRGLADRLLAMLKGLAAIPTACRIDRYQHALQSATRALRDGADEETVVCALLHDVGVYLTTENHAAIAAEILRPYISEESHWMLTMHGVFQGYYSWHHLGRDRNERERYRDHPCYERTVRFCERWDQASFDPDYDTLPLENFEPMVRRVLERRASRAS